MALMKLRTNGLLSAVSTTVGRLFGSVLIANPKG